MPCYRVLTKGTSAEVEIRIRVAGMSGPSAKTRPLPLEPFAVNKEMGRILIRRGGETIGAGRRIVFRTRATGNLQCGLQGSFKNFADDIDRFRNNTATKVRRVRFALLAIYTHHIWEFRRCNPF
jgi:hypothetical protein